MQKTKTKATWESKRLRGLLLKANTSDETMKMLEPIIENVAWMKIKLDAARELIKDSDLVIEYDNGGGQSGIRENPLFKGYEALWKAYMQGMSKILEYLPAEVVREAAPETERPKNMLELVRKKHEKEA